MTAPATIEICDRPDPWSWLIAMVGRGVAMFSMNVDDNQGVEAEAGHSTTELDIDDLRKARGWDEQAFERIVRRYQHEVSRRLRRFSRDPHVHEELVQETFVRAFMGLHKFRGDAPLIHWLHRIAVRVGYRFWTERRARPVLESLDGRDVHSTDARSNSAINRLHEVLEQLSPRDRLVITLLHLEERSVEDTAVLTGWSRTMVKVQAFRARRRLRALMREAERAP